MTYKIQNAWTPEEKLRAVLEALTLSDEAPGAFLRSKGLHETHLFDLRFMIFKTYVNEYFL